MANNEHNIVVGEKVFYQIYTNRRESTLAPVVISKVGRKWVHFNNGWHQHKADISSLVVDGNGYTSPGRLWLSVEAYETHQEVQSEWSELRFRLERMYKYPEGMTPEKIQKIKELIGE